MNHNYDSTLNQFYRLVEPHQNCDRDQRSSIVFDALQKIFGSFVNTATKRYITADIKEKIFNQLKGTEKKIELKRLIHSAFHIREGSDTSRELHNLDPSVKLESIFIYPEKDSSILRIIDIVTPYFINKLLYILNNKWHSLIKDAMNNKSGYKKQFKYVTIYVQDGKTITDLISKDISGVSLPHIRMNLINRMEILKTQSSRILPAKEEKLSQTLGNKKLEIQVKNFREVDEDLAKIIKRFKQIIDISERLNGSKKQEYNKFFKESYNFFIASTDTMSDSHPFLYAAMKAFNSLMMQDVNENDQMRFMKYLGEHYEMIRIIQGQMSDEEHEQLKIVIANYNHNDSKDESILVFQEIVRPFLINKYVGYLTEELNRIITPSEGKMQEDVNFQDIFKLVSLIERVTVFASLDTKAIEKNKIIDLCEVLSRISKLLKEDVKKGHEEEHLEERVLITKGREVLEESFRRTIFRKSALLQHPLGSPRKRTILERLAANVADVEKQQSQETLKAFQLQMDPIPKVVQDYYGNPVTLGLKDITYSDDGVEPAWMASCRRGKESRNRDNLSTHTVCHAEYVVKDEDDLPNDVFSVYGLYEGFSPVAGIYNDYEAANFVKTHLPLYLKKAIKLENGENPYFLTKEGIFNAIKRCFKNLPTGYKQECASQNHYWGPASTKAVVVLNIQGRTWVANIGGSRAIHNGKQLNDAQVATSRVIDTQNGISRPKITVYEKLGNKLILGSESFFKVTSIQQVTEAVDDMTKKRLPKAEIAQRLVWSAFAASDKREDMTVFIV